MTGLVVDGAEHAELGVAAAVCKAVPAASRRYGDADSAAAAREDPRRVLSCSWHNSACTLGEPYVIRLSAWRRRTVLPLMPCRDAISRCETPSAAIALPCAHSTALRTSQHPSVVSPTISRLPTKPVNTRPPSDALFSSETWRSIGLLASRAYRALGMSVTVRESLSSASDVHGCSGP